MSKLKRIYSDFIDITMIGEIASDYDEKTYADEKVIKFKIKKRENIDSNSPTFTVSKKNFSEQSSLDEERVHMIKKGNIVVVKGLFISTVPQYLSIKNLGTIYASHLDVFPGDSKEAAKAEIKINKEKSIEQAKEEFDL
jgi:hypothetical protein